MQDTSIQLGLTGNAECVVNESNVASALGSGTVIVFATPAMLALMEEAAVDALAGVMPDGWLSVGVYAEIHHLAATPPGMTVQATATVTAVEGRVVTLDVQAHDDTELIGHGVHRRVIVDSARVPAASVGQAGTRLMPRVATVKTGIRTGDFSARAWRSANSGVPSSSSNVVLTPRS